MRYTWAAVAVIALLAVSVGVGAGYFIFNLQNTQSQLEEAKSRAKALQQDVESLQEKEKKLAAERDNMEAKITTIVNKLDAVNSSLSSNKKESQDLKLQVSDLKVQLQEVAAGLGVRIEEIRSASRVRDAQIVNATKQIEDLRKQTVDTNKQLVNATKQIEGSKNQTEILKKQVADLSKQIADLRKVLAAPGDQSKPTLACTPGDVVFEEEFEDDFEMVHGIAGHGWIPLSVSGAAQTQPTIFAKGLRALRIDDPSGNLANLYQHALPSFAGNFQVDFYLRAGQYGLPVSLYLQGNQGVPDGQVRGIVAELSDNANRDFRVQKAFYFPYQLNKWYHIRLVVRTSLQSFDTYVDDMSNPLERNIKVLDTSFDRISVGTGTAGTGAGYWDGITITCLP